ncbi:MAG: PQQ-binding-like beta-propeller repeat protein [Tetrasphaera sp.]|nr:PQQ-binding-like beta-propeller repeat protein [Tetrasphaera sp.]
MTRSPSHRSRHVLPTLMAVVCLLAACTSGSDPAPSDSGATTPVGTSSASPNPGPSAAVEPVGPLTELWRTRGLTPVSQVAVVAGMPVTYVSAGRRLYLVGLDPKSGKETWRVEASVSLSTGRASVRSIKDQVLALVPAHPGAKDGKGAQATVALIDPTDGTVTTGPLAAVYHGLPRPCEDDKALICVETKAPKQPADVEDVVTVAHRVDPATLAVGPALPGDSAAYVQTMGLRGDGETRIIRSQGGQTLWTFDITTLAKDLNLGNGWSGEYYPATRTVVLTVTRLFGKKSVDLAGRGVVVALSVDTGAVLWKASDLSTMCGEHTVDETTTVVLACRSTGSITWGSFSGPFVFKGVRERVVGLDVRTGRVIWESPQVTHPNASTESFPELLTIRDLEDRGRLSVGASYKGAPPTRVLDPKDGTMRELAKGEAVWDLTYPTFDLFYPMPMPWNPAEPGNVGGRVLAVVHGNGSPAKVWPWYLPTRDVVDGVGFIAVDDAVVALRETT